MRIIAKKIANIIVSSLAVVNSWTRHRLQWLFVCETRSTAPFASSGSWGTKLNSGGWKKIADDLRSLTGPTQIYRRKHRNDSQ